MFIQIILLLVGFIILIKGADYFIDGASEIAKHFNIPKILIGLTIVSLGTSAPEFAISCNSVLSNKGDMIIGTVIGSNIINILLILGICSVISPIKVKSTTVKKEMPFNIMISSLFAILLCDNVFNYGIVDSISRADGLVIVIFLLIFLYYLFSITKKSNDKEENEISKYSLKKSIFISIIGAVSIIMGSDLVVDSATNVAKALHVSDRIISLTIIAFGTGLPELASSISAALKKEHDIVLGNIIGSNIYNIGLVLGVPVMLFGGVTPNGFNNFDIFVLLISTLLLFLFSVDSKITKLEGIGMLLLFIAYYAFTIYKGVII